MIAEIKNQGWLAPHRVILDGELVALFPTRTEALALVNKLLKADFARLDLHTEGHARLWKHFDR